GHAALAGASQFTNGASVLLGNGDGSFQDALPFAVGDSPAGGATGDFNGDGRLDVAFTNFFSDEHGLSVYLGRGDGTFQDPLRFDVGPQPYGLVTGDFNGDGYLDLANTNYGAQSVSVLPGRGAGTFGDETRFATQGLPESLLARDFNGDGRLDLAVTSDVSDSLSVLLGRGDGTFEEQVQFRVGDGPSPRRGLGAGDFNGDGRL